jgi:hypothetical protein
MKEAILFFTHTVLLAILWYKFIMHYAEKADESAGE